MSRSTLLRVAATCTVLCLAGAGQVELMRRDTHFLLLGLLGASAGLLVGSLWDGGRWLLAGAVIGFLVALGYLPLWLLFDLPPAVDFNL